MSDEGDINFIRYIYRGEEGEQIPLDATHIIVHEDAGWDDGFEMGAAGGKDQAIREWIRSIIRKINHFKTEHQRFLDEEAASILELVLPQDIVTKNVLPFLTLPSHTFGQF